MNHRYKDITYSLFQRKRRKTASIHVERDGGVSVIVPDTLSTKEIERLIETKRRWIYRQLAEWQDLNASRIRREFVNGEGFLVPWEVVSAKAGSGQEKPLLLKDGYFCLRKSRSGEWPRRSRFQGVLPRERSCPYTRSRGYVPITPWGPAGGSAGHGSEKPLGLVFEEFCAQLSLEVHNGPFDCDRLHCRSRVGAFGPPQSHAEILGGDREADSRLC